MLDLIMTVFASSHWSHHVWESRGYEVFLRHQKTFITDANQWLFSVVISSLCFCLGSMLPQNRSFWMASVVVAFVSLLWKWATLKQWWWKRQISFVLMHLFHVREGEGKHSGKETPQTPCTPPPPPSHPSSWQRDVCKYGWVTVFVGVCV